MNLIAELFPDLRQLSRAEKWQVVQFLMKELSQDDVPLLQADQTYPLPSPHDAFEAGQTLLRLLADTAPAREPADA